MQKPEIILNNFSKQTVKVGYKFNKIYKNLYNPELYIRAYGSMYAKEGNMTPGVDGKTIDGFSMKNVEKLIESLRDLSYQPLPARREYIDKKSGGKRPLGIPAIYDKLLQKVLAEILESIYEPVFLESSHGFRPNKSCHSAITSIKAKCTGMKWWIEGDIKGFFDNINHQTLIKLLRKKIKDERLLNLISKFLKAGYMEDWKYNKTLSGTPQGGIISPILANIYLHELDVFVDELIKEFNKGKSRQRNKTYRLWEDRAQKLQKKMKLNWENYSQEEKKEFLKKLKNYRQEKAKFPVKDPMDGAFKRLQYVRYADDFILGVIGSKEDAKNIKDRIKNFIQGDLQLELSEEKTKITNASDKARFLGYDIFVSSSQQAKKDSLGRLTRTISGHVMVSMPFDKIREFMFNNGYILECKNNVWKAKHRNYLINCDALEIISTYNAEIRGYYNYYKIAYDVHRLGNFHQLIRLSCLKTLAAKHKTSTKKILGDNVKGVKYTLNGEFGVFYETKNNKKNFRTFYNEGYRYDKEQTKNTFEDGIDNLPNTIIYSASRNGLETRLKANVCENCGSKDKDCEVHHVRKLKDLKGKKAWEKKMIGRNRKTIVLCTSCHDKLHAGKLD